ncbi:hypothetical protein P8452_12855 [Trifolium repens]|nr:hypothetical protein P8452_12855 [Trifolium repens]
MSTKILLLILTLFSFPFLSLSLNLTLPLLKAKHFTIFASLLTETKLDNDLQAFTTGITMFIPVDEAFQHMSKYPQDLYEKFSIEDKYILVKSHILPDYYTLQTLRSSVSIFKLQTLATLDKGPGQFLLNISTLTSSVLELARQFFRCRYIFIVS